MWTKTRRPVVPVLLLIGGIASTIYGAWFHYIPVVGGAIRQVVEEQEIEETITLPPPFEPPPGFPPPPPIVQTIVRKVSVTKDVIEDVTKDERELTLILEASVGGIELLASGQLRRTYGPTLDGEGPTKMPSLCPT